MNQTRRDEIDLLLFDVVLPRLSGPQVYSRITEIKPAVPLIFATGYSGDIVSLQTAQQQGVPVLQKLYSPRSLARKVRDTLDQLRPPARTEPRQSP